MKKIFQTGEYYVNLLKEWLESRNLLTDKKTI